MNGVMTDAVSAGSNHVGASVMCTAHVSSPSGAAAAGAAARSRSRATARGFTMASPRPDDTYQRMVDAIERLLSPLLGTLERVEWVQRHLYPPLAGRLAEKLAP